MRRKMRPMGRDGAAGDAGLGRALVLVAALALVGTKAQAESRAVVVGIDDYAGLGEGAALAGAVADARRYRDLLIRSRGFEARQVTLLTDDAATSDAILTAVIDELIGRTGARDRAVFYFAGLGTLVAGEAEGASVPAIVSHDTGSLLGRIPEDMMADLFDLIPDREVMVVIDASFAGAERDPGGDVRARGVLPDGRAPGPPANELFGQGAVARNVWNAAGPGQVAWEEDGAGVFTGAFLAGQSGAADSDGDGQVSNGELLAFVEERAEDWCRATPACSMTGRGFVPAFADGPRPADPPVPTSSQGDGFAELLAFVTEELAPTNAAGLRLSLEGPEPLRIGDTATLIAEADRPGRLLLLDLHAAVGLTVVAPDLALGGERAEPLALRFRAAEPVGSGAFIGVLLDGAEAGEVLPETPAGEPGRLLGGLSEALRRLSDRGAAWSATVLPYEIAP